MSRAGGQRLQEGSASASERLESASGGEPWSAAPPVASRPVPVPVPAHGRAHSHGERAHLEASRAAAVAATAAGAASPGAREAPFSGAARACSRAVRPRPLLSWTLSSRCNPLLRRDEARRGEATLRLQAHGAPASAPSRGDHARRVQPGAEGGCRGRRSGQPGRPGTTFYIWPLGPARRGRRCWRRDTLRSPGRPRGQGEGPAGQCTWGSSPRPSACAPRPATGPQRPILPAAASPPGPCSLLRAS